MYLFYFENFYYIRKLFKEKEIYLLIKFYYNYFIDKASKFAQRSVQINPKHVRYSHSPFHQCQTKL